MRFWLEEVGRDHFLRPIGDHLADARVCEAELDLRLRARLVFAIFQRTDVPLGDIDVARVSVIDNPPVQKKIKELSA